jgi:hypothetical protein
MSSTPARPLPVHVELNAVSRRIPRSFLGLSVEVSELSTYARASAAVDRAVALMRPASESEMPLRVGGRSADDAYWKLRPADAPAWLLELDDDWVNQLAALAHRDRFRVTLALNVAVHSPAMAVSLASAVSQALEPDGLAGLAIGNEPDLFRYQPGLDKERIASTLPSTPRAWTRHYSARRYRRDYLAYARALARALPDVRLVGPETTTASRAWLGALTGLGRLSPRVLTVHRYRLSSCRAQDSPFYPRISALLAEGATAGLANRLHSAVRFARRARKSVVLSEINSMSCGGAPGVADSFATALWAPDALFSLLRAGVDGVNLHVRAAAVNAPFALGPTGLQARPLLYGLILFARTLGPHAQLVTLRSHLSRAANVAAWAVRVGRDTLHVLLLDKSRRPERVSLHLPAAGTAAVQRLLAPSAASRSGVTLGGRALGADGRWRGLPVSRTVTPRGGAYAVSVRSMSAALITVRVRPDALGVR